MAQFLGPSTEGGKDQENTLKLLASSQNLIRDSALTVFMKDKKFARPSLSANNSWIDFLSRDFRTKNQQFTFIALCPRPDKTERELV